MKKSKLLTILTITAIWASGCSKDVGWGPAGDRKRLGRFLLHDFTGGRHRGNQQSRYPDATRRIYPGYGKTCGWKFSSGIGTVASYDVMSDYDQPLLQAGDYQADFSYGNPDTEGENAGCFKGTKQFTVVARKTTTEQVSLSLVNSV